MINTVDILKENDLNFLPKCIFRSHRSSDYEQSPFFVSYSWYPVQLLSQRLWQTFSSPTQSRRSLTPVANGTKHAHAGCLKPRGEKENSFSETKVEKRVHDLERDSDSDDDRDNRHGNAPRENLPIFKLQGLKSLILYTLIHKKPPPPSNSKQL